MAAVVRITGTPESRTAEGKTPPLTLLPISTALSSPSTKTLMLWTFTFQKCVPRRSDMSGRYLITLGSVRYSGGCLPIPSKAFGSDESGREREMEKNRCRGALDVGVIEKRLDARTAPSGSLLILGGRFAAMIELRGKDSPRIPAN